MLNLTPIVVVNFLLHSYKFSRRLTYGKGMVYINCKQITYQILGLKTPSLNVNYHSQFLVQIRDKRQTAILDTTKSDDLEWLSTRFTVPTNWKELEYVNAD